MLEKVLEFIEESNATNSSNDKLQVLEKFKDEEVVRKVLFYTYNDFLQYGVTPDNCRKLHYLYANNYSDLFTLLEDLADRTITGHSAVAAVNGFVDANKEYEELIWMILDRNLKTRSTTTMINKVIPNLIPTFDVVLATAYDAKIAEKMDWTEGWYISRKLDGVRCITIIDKTGDVKFYSRAGKEFTTLFKLKKSIEKLGLSNKVIDGEICIIDDKGNESFSDVVSQIKRKNYTIENPFYYMFDFLTIEEFFSKSSERPLSTRIAKLRELISPDAYLAILPQVVGSEERLTEMIKESKDHGWEGLMIRKDVGYEGKRTKNLLKVKQFHDEEFVVTSVINEVHRVVENGEEIEEEMLGAVTFNYKGNEVKVGSGFSKEQRRRYHSNPELIIGKQITVQYFEESRDKEGNYSLRFPVIKTVYETERDI